MAPLEMWMRQMEMWMRMQLDPRMTRMLGSAAGPMINLQMVSALVPRDECSGPVPKVGAG